MVIRSLLFWSVLFSFSLFSQTPHIANDTILIVKNVYFSSPLIVPANKIWKIHRVFVSNNTFNVGCCSYLKNNAYHSGDTIRFPYYIPEMDLLEQDHSKLHIVVEIKETDIKK
ncbi:MAG: hypothetical protein OHK0036_04560 [Bacteroidia bacterium]